MHQESYCPLILPTSSLLYGLLTAGQQNNTKSYSMVSLTYAAASSALYNFKTLSNLRTMQFPHMKQKEQNRHFKIHLVSMLFSHGHTQKTNPRWLPPHQHAKFLSPPVCKNGNSDGEKPFLPLDSQKPIPFIFPWGSNPCYSCFVVPRLGFMEAAARLRTHRLCSLNSVSPVLASETKQKKEHKLFLFFFFFF